MAIIKRRIMSRARIASIMDYRMRDPYGRLRNVVQDGDERQAQIDIAMYVIADGKEVKIYNDTNMGGPVVEYDDGQ